MTELYRIVMDYIEEEVLLRQLSHHGVFARVRETGEFEVELIGTHEQLVAALKDVWGATDEDVDYWIEMALVPLKDL